MHPTHEKHAKLARPAYGTFHRKEWAIIGAPCDHIQNLSRALIERLSDRFRLAFVDADHKSADSNEKAPRSMLTYGGGLEYTDKITHHRFELRGQMESYQFRPWFNGQDGVLVNGNHFQANQQIVVIDPKKEDSLRRKLDRLTDVRAILLTAEGPAPYSFLREHLDNPDAIPTFQIHEVEAIAVWMAKELAHTAPLYGLVLAGGKSRRMGEDKSLLNYHGQPQREYLYQLLERFTERTYLSCRPDQTGEMPASLNLLPDSFLGLGPFGAILSAFREQPEAAWLVLACDLPLVDTAALQELVRHRHPGRVATAFHNPETGFPDPLITLWEPRSYPVLLQFLAQGYSCPRKALINSEVEIVQPERPEILKNVNTQAEMEDVMKELEKQKTM